MTSAPGASTSAIGSDANPASNADDLEVAKAQLDLDSDELDDARERAGLSGATPSVNLRPSGSVIDLHVRYIARASQRVEMRNRFYRLAIDVLHGCAPAPQPA